MDEFDGFQRLGWVAVARAIAEPELRREVIISATRAVRSASTRRDFNSAFSDTAYLWQLARELSSMPVGTWIRDRGVWSEVGRLAFRYLDVDGDGLLSPQDLVSHLASSTSLSPSSLQLLSSKSAAVAPGDVVHDALAAVNLWVSRWSYDETPTIGNEVHHCGIGPQGFRAAMAASPPMWRNSEPDLDDDFCDGSRDKGLESWHSSDGEFCSWSDIKN